jgi:hypothetical protein
MLSTRSRLSAGSSYARQRFLSPWALLVFAAAIGMVLVLIFPQKTLIEQIMHSERMDGLTLSYLQNLLRTNPDNQDMRLLLGQLQLRQGQPHSARYTLEPLQRSKDPAIRRPAMLAIFEALEEEAKQAAAGGRVREETLVHLRQTLVELLKFEWDAAQLEILVGKAMALQRPDIAVQLYQQLADSGTQSHIWLVRAAKAALAQGNYRSAATLYFSARDKADSLELKRQYFIEAVKVLQSGNLLNEAMQAAETHLGELKNDQATLLFLARLARSANRLDLAEIYVKELLHMAVVERLNSYLTLAQERRHGAAGKFMPDAFALNPNAGQGRNATTSAPTRRMLPFNDEIYTLSYEIFLAIRNLNDAYLVAESAVTQVPDHLRWRKNLAQVAEWSQHPQVALQQWVFLAKAQNSEAAWQNVLRLAPGLQDDDSLILALQRDVERSLLSTEKLQRLIAAYEAAGRTDEGVKFLERLDRQRPSKMLLEQIAVMYEHLGNNDNTLQTYAHLEKRYGASPELAMKQASLLYVQGKPEAAFTTLAAVRNLASQRDSAFWQLFGDLAWQLQHRPEALAAYQKLLDAEVFNESNVERLIVLKRPDHHEEALKLGLLGWQRFHKPQFLLPVLESYTQHLEWRRAAALFESMSTAELKLFSDIPHFWILRGQTWQAVGRPAAALADYLQALRINSSSGELRASVLWLLVDQKNQSELRKYLRLWRADAETNPALWAVFAAGYTTLGEVRLALPFYAKEVAQHKVDYLWLLSYADALEAAERPDFAWRVRRYAWLDLRRQGANVTADQSLLEAYTKLALQQAPGDPAAALLRELLRQGQHGDGDKDKPSPINASTNELVLSWMLPNEQFDAARMWLWKNYAGQLARPAWAEVTLALASNDTEQLQQLLTWKADDLPLYDKIDAARQTGQMDLAGEFAFQGLERNPGLDVVHLQLTEVILDNPSSAGFRMDVVEHGVLHGLERQLNLALNITSHLRLTAEVSSFSQESADTATLVGVPGNDRQFGATLAYHDGNNSVALRLSRRLALSEFNAWEVVVAQQWLRDLTSEMSLGRNLLADEGTALRVGGVKDRLQLDFGYRLGKRESIGGRLAYNRFYSQERVYLGQGKVLEGHAGYQFRTEYPDFNLRLDGALHRYDANGSVSGNLLNLVPTGVTPDIGQFMPQSFNQYGVSFGFGDYHREHYTRGLRPFADIGVSHNSITGNGHSFSLGVAGSIDGEDHFSIYWADSRGGSEFGQSDRRIGMRYQHFLGK